MQEGKLQLRGRGARLADEERGAAKRRGRGFGRRNKSFA